MRTTRTGRRHRRLSLVGAVLVATAVAGPAGDRATAQAAPAGTVQTGDRTTAQVGGRAAAGEAAVTGHAPRVDGMPRLAAGGDALVVVVGAGAGTVVSTTGGQPAWSAQAADAALVWPARGRVTSEFGRRSGRMHEGMDIAAPVGTPITAAGDGLVVFAGWKGGYGRTVDIAHGDGLVTRYAHQSETTVARGNRIRRGERIGRVGTTGASTGPHVHFEVRMDGDEHNPRNTLIHL
jgi:murein DD-endopeptidase MepM/ murein hydrolase activator NlpD